MLRHEGKAIGIFKEKYIKIMLIKDKRKGLSQRELANKVALLGVTLYNSDISRIENNTLFLRDYEEYAICKVLGISVSQLHEDSDQYFN